MRAARPLLAPSPSPPEKRHNKPAFIGIKLHPQKRVSPGGRQLGLAHPESETPGPALSRPMVDPGAETPPAASSPSPSISAGTVEARLPPLAC